MERAIHLVQGMIRKIRSDIEETGEVKVDMTDSVWPCIAQQAASLPTKFEVGRDGTTACERVKGKSAKVQGLSVAEGTLWRRRRAGGRLGKLTCMLDDVVARGGGETSARRKLSKADCIGVERRCEGEGSITALCRTIQFESVLHLFLSHMHQSSVTGHVHSTIRRTLSQRVHAMAQVSRQKSAVPLDICCSLCSGALMVTIEELAQQMRIFDERCQYLNGERAE